MRGAGDLLLWLAVALLVVGSYYAVWYVGHVVMTIGVPCAGLGDRLKLAWLSIESSRVNRNPRQLADWSAHKRERLAGATASALYLDAVQADALIRSDEYGAAADLLDRIGEGGLRLGKLMVPGWLETKWVLAAVRLGRYEQRRACWSGYWRFGVTPSPCASR